MIVNKMKPKKEFMQLAIDVGREGVLNGQAPFGAVIVKDEKVIVAAHNVVWETTDITAHAEVNAIRLACEKLQSIDLSGCVIYSTCEPCPMCFCACHWVKFSHIVFGVSIEDAKAVGFNELVISNEKLKELGKSSVEVIGNFMREENLRLLNEWKELFVDRAY